MFLFSGLYSICTSVDMEQNGIGRSPVVIVAFETRFIVGVSPTALGWKIVTLFKF